MFLFCQVSLHAQQLFLCLTDRLTYQNPWYTMGKTAGFALYQASFSNYWTGPAFCLEQFNGSAFVQESKGNQKETILVESFAEQKGVLQHVTVDERKGADLPLFLSLQWKGVADIFWHCWFCPLVCSSCVSLVVVCLWCNTSINNSSACSAAAPLLMWMTPGRYELSQNWDDDRRILKDWRAKLKALIELQYRIYFIGHLALCIWAATAKLYSI